LDRLDEHLLPALDQLLDAAPVALLALELGNDDLVDIKEPVLLEPDVDEGRLHAREDVVDGALGDVARDPRGGGARPREDSTTTSLSRPATRCSVTSTETRISFLTFGSAERFAVCVRLRRAFASSPSFGFFWGGWCS